MQKVTSRTTALALLTAAGVHTKKKLSQNFLIDENIARKIVMQADIQPEDVVVEVGPGIGALSQILAPLCRHCVLIELDAEMAEILKEVMAPFHNVQILHADALRCDYAKLLRMSFLKGKKRSCFPMFPIILLLLCWKSCLPMRHCFLQGLSWCSLKWPAGSCAGPERKTIRRSVRFAPIMQSARFVFV